MEFLIDSKVENCKFSIDESFSGTTKTYTYGGHGDTDNTPILYFENSKVELINCSVTAELRTDNSVSISHVLCDHSTTVDIIGGTYEHNTGGPNPSLGGGAIFMVEGGQKRVSKINMYTVEEGIMVRVMIR